MGSVGRGGEQHSQSGNGPPILSPETPADGQMLPEGQGLRQEVGNVPTARRGSRVRTRS